MGHWSMIIHGHGIHHNGRPDDADSLLREFVTRLKGSGHEVHAASVTTGAIEHHVPVDDGAPVAPAPESGTGTAEEDLEVPAETPEPEPAG